VRWKGLETSLHQKFKLPPESWALGGISLPLPESMPSFFLKNSTSWALCSLNPKLIRSLSFTLHHKFCLTRLALYINCISFTLNFSFRTNSAQTRGVEIFTGLTYELCVEWCLQALSQHHSHVTLFPFCHFHIHLGAIESLIRGHAMGNTVTRNDTPTECGSLLNPQANKCWSVASYTALQASIRLY
jgi:hypothetical protein